MALMADVFGSGRATREPWCSSLIVCSKDVFAAWSLSLRFEAAWSPSNVKLNCENPSPSAVDSPVAVSASSSSSSPRCSSSILNCSASRRSLASLDCNDPSSPSLVLSESDVALCLCHRLLLLILYDFRSAPILSEKSTSLASTTARSNRRLASSWSMRWRSSPTSGSCLPSSDGEGDSERSVPVCSSQQESRSVGSVSSLEL